MTGVAAFPAHAMRAAEPQQGGSQDCTSTLSPVTEAVTGAAEGTFTWAGPTSAWPPNHKPITGVSITLTDDDSEPALDDVVLTVVPSHDEQITDATGAVTGEQNGSGNTDPTTDATGGTDTGAGSATVPLTFRAERAGTGDGREYYFTATGTTDNGATECDPVTFVATVPHDKGNGKPKGAVKLRVLKGKKAKRRSARR